MAGSGHRPYTCSRRCDTLSLRKEQRFYAYLLVQFWLFSA